MKNYKLSEITLNLIDGKHGGCSSVKGSGYYFISVKDLKFNNIDYSSAKEISIDDFVECNKRTKLEIGDTVYANSGDTIGKSVYISENAKNVDKTTFQKSVAILKPNKDFVYPKYLYYLLKYETPRLRKVSSGSAQKNLLLDTMRNFEVSIHEKEQQKRILELLDPIDKLISCKIELNKEINKILSKAYSYYILGEQQNKSNIWEKISLKDILEFEKGIEVPTIMNPKNIDDYIRLYKVGDMDEELDNKKGEYIKKDKSSCNKVIPTDVLVSFDGTPGKVSIGLEGCYSSGIRKIYSKNNKISKSLIYLIFKSTQIQFIINQYSTGSNILHAGEAISHLEILYNEDIYNKFAKKFDDLFDLLVNNIVEIRKAIEFRDKLIPLLFANKVKL